MANVTTTADLKTEILRSCGEITDGSSDYDARAVELINVWHRAVLSGSTELNIECGDPWVWARSQYPGIVILQPPHKGTVALTNGSVDGTFAVAPSVSLANWYIKLDNRSEHFRIATHTAGQTAFTLDSVYTDNSATSISCVVSKLDYSLSGVLRLVAPFRNYRINDGQIDVIDKSAFDRDYPLHRITNGVPSRIAITHQGNDGTYTIRINKIPTTQIRIEYDYIPYPADLTASPDTAPLIPKEHRQILVYAPAYSLCVEKNDDRAIEYKSRAATLLEALAQSNRRIKGNAQRNFGRLIPRRDYRGL